MSKATETKAIIEMLEACAAWFEKHGKNTNTAAISICRDAAERLADLEKIAEFYRVQLEKTVGDLETIKEGLIAAGNLLIDTAKQPEAEAAE